MARLITCGWETGDVNEQGLSVVGSNNSLTVVNTVPVPRSGNYCLKAAITASTQFNATYKSFTFTPVSELWIRFAFIAHSMSGAEKRIANLNDSTGTLQDVLAHNPSDGLLRVYRGATTLLGTASTSFAQDEWHIIEWRVQLLTTTTGATEVWLDGTQVITFSGDTSATTTLNAAALWLGNNDVETGLTTSTYYAFDDIAINSVSGTLNNGRPGDGKIVLLSPNGAGSSTAWTRGGTDTGANYSQTSEVPSSMTQYVLSSTVAARDLYALTNLPSGVDSINAVEVLALAQNSDAGAGSVGLTVKSSSTTNEGTAQSLGTSAAYIRQQYETDPATSAAWTTSAVNALEAGATVR